MKKRVISFMCVLVFVFTGAFSCLASADGGGVVSRYFDFWKRYVQSIDSPWDVTSPGFYSFLVDFLADQKTKASDTTSVSGGSHTINIEFGNPDVDTLSYSFGGGLALFPNLSDYSFFVYVDEEPSYWNYPPDYTFLAYVRFVAVSNRYKDYCQYYQRDGYDYIVATQDIPYYFCRFDCGWDNSKGGMFYDLSTFNYNEGSNLYRASILRDTGNPGFYDNPNGHNRTASYILFNDFVAAPLRFSADLVVSDDTLDITLRSSRPILSDIDGLLAFNAGILYDDGSDIMFAGKFYDYGPLEDMRDEWHFSFDLDEFSEYAYRKRCGIDNYYGFISVMDQELQCVFSRECMLNLDLPGIFDDVEDPPKWPDYKPDPSPDPDPPSVTFNFSPSTTTYQDFHFETVNNITFNFGGDGSSGGSGGSGSGGDSSSGSDPGSGTNPVTPSDDSSRYDDFFEWYGDTVITYNNNFEDAVRTLNENIQRLGDYILDYLRAILDYLNRVLTAHLEYIEALIDKYNNDFIAWTDAFGEFLGDLFDTLNHNIAVIGDNIVKAIKTQVVPDQEVMINILNSHVPGFSDMQTGFDTFEPVEDDLFVSIPLFDVGVSDSAEVSSDSVITSGYDASSGVYNFNFSEAFNDPIYGRLRSFGIILIMGSTFLTAINIFLKIFGLGSSNDEK